MDAEENYAKLDSSLQDQGATTVACETIADGVDSTEDQNMNMGKIEDARNDYDIKDCIIRITTPGSSSVHMLTQPKQKIRLRLDFYVDIPDHDHKITESAVCKPDEATAGVSTSQSTITKDVATTGLPTSKSTITKDEATAGLPTSKSSITKDEAIAPLPTSESNIIADEDCTSENWTSFVSWKTRKSRSADLFDSNAEFGEDTLAVSKPISVTKIVGSTPDRFELAINSLYLQTQLRKVVDIEKYSGVGIFSSKIVLYDQFSPLFHHIDDLRKMVTEDDTATEKNRQDVMTLYYFTTKSFLSNLYGDVRNKISQGFIMYEEVWALFKIGDHAVMKGPFGHFDIAKIESVILQTDKETNTSTWLVSLVKYSWRLGQFRKVNTTKMVAPFYGSMKIAELNFYPLRYHDDQDAACNDAIARGKSWKKYLEREATTMSYEGLAVPLIAGQSENDMMGSSFNYSVSERDYKILTLCSTVIVDPAAVNKATLQATIDGRVLVSLSDFRQGTKLEIVEGEGFTDEDFKICPSTFTVFSLDDHEWYSIDVANLKEKNWRPKSFDRLVLDPIKKETLARLAKTNSKMVQSNKLEDIIEGKGRGIVLLLHGPPGVGKTLTAEVLSEKCRRPLLKVNLGRVASHSRWEQALEQIFSNAQDWKAILLIDEAEIVLEKRTFERMTQNSWISVFLRKLEYYKGILILTTNLVDCIDEAFESRISYAVKFPELCQSDRHRIWHDFIQDIRMLPAYKNALLENLDRWSAAEINGRQIRNVVLMAENLAASDESHPRLTPEHIDDLLNVTLEFCLYNQASMARSKKIQFTGPSY